MSDPTASAPEPDLTATQPTDTLRTNPLRTDPLLPDAHAAESGAARQRKPRIRSGAIVWGLIVSAAALFLLAIVTSPANSAAFGAWTGSLGWGGAILVAMIALGAFILIMALLSAIRGAQRRRSAS